MEMRNLSNVHSAARASKHQVQDINIVLFMPRQGPFSVVLVKRPSRHRKNLRYIKGCTQMKGLLVVPFVKSPSRQQGRWRCTKCLTVISGLLNALCVIATSSPHTK